jgi:hypothetical protein
MDTSMKLEALGRAESRDHYDHTVGRLKAILSTWEATGDVPDEVGVLSSGEYRALVLAAGREDLLGRSPVRDFLLLDGWLQKWVMETRGWTGLIGTRIGD